jgi:hypothetical protein
MRPLLQQIFSLIPLFFLRHLGPDPVPVQLPDRVIPFAALVPHHLYFKLPGQREVLAREPLVAIDVCAVVCLRVVEVLAELVVGLSRFFDIEAHVVDRPVVHVSYYADQIL